MTKTIFDDDVDLSEVDISFSDKSQLIAHIDYHGTAYACSVAPDTSRYYPTPTRMFTIQGKEYHVVEKVIEKSRFDEILAQNNTSAEKLTLEVWEDLESDKEEWKKLSENYVEALSWQKELNNSVDGYFEIMEKEISQIRYNMLNFERNLTMRMNELVWESFFNSERSLKHDFTRENGLKLYDFIFPSIMFVNENFYITLLNEIVYKGKIKDSELLSWLDAC